MPTLRYDLLRALELEGRHRHDSGVWQVTARRLETGEGVPLPFDPAGDIEYTEGQPLPAAPKLASDQLKRAFYYRRVRSAAEAERVIREGKVSVSVSLELFSGWRNPEGGVIPMPASEESPLTLTHGVVLGAADAGRRRFAFRNTWGPTWGKQGFGFLPFEYFDRYAFEAWASYTALRVETSRKLKAGNHQEGRWTVRDEQNRRRYGFELWHEATNERLAWAFVLDTNAGLEIEDFYVRPEHRGQGHARHLAGRLRELAQARGEPLRLWVPFADSRQESPGTYPALAALARHLGVQFQPCPVRWAAYLATNEQAGSPEPIEPVRIPARPTATLAAITLAE